MQGKRWPGSWIVDGSEVTAAFIASGVPAERGRLGAGSRKVPTADLSALRSRIPAGTAQSAKRIGFGRRPGCVNQKIAVPGYPGTGCAALLAMTFLDSRPPIGSRAGFAGMTAL